MDRTQAWKILDELRHPLSHRAKALHTLMYLDTPSDANRLAEWLIAHLPHAHRAECRAYVMVAEHLEVASDDLRSRLAGVLLQVARQRVQSTHKQDLRIVQGCATSIVKLSPIIGRDLFGLITPQIPMANQLCLIQSLTLGCARSPTPGYFSSENWMKRYFVELMVPKGKTDHERFQLGVEIFLFFVVLDLFEVESMIQILQKPWMASARDLAKKRLKEFRRQEKRLSDGQRIQLANIIQSLQASTYHV